MRKLRTPTVAGIGLHRRPSRMAVLYHLEFSAQGWEEGEPVFQDEDVSAMFFLRCDPLRVYILPSQSVRPFQQRLAAGRFRPEEPSLPRRDIPYARVDSFSTPAPVKPN